MSEDVTVIRTGGGDIVRTIPNDQVVWYVPEAPYVVLVPHPVAGVGVAGCRVYGPYGWLEAGRVAERLGGYARAVVSEGGE